MRKSETPTSTFVHQLPAVTPPYVEHFLWYFTDLCNFSQTVIIQRSKSSKTVMPASDNHTNWRTFKNICWSLRDAPDGLLALCLAHLGLLVALGHNVAERGAGDGPLELGRATGPLLRHLLLQTLLVLAPVQHRPVDLTRVPLHRVRLLAFRRHEHERLQDEESLMLSEGSYSDQQKNSRIDRSRFPGHFRRGISNKCSKQCVLEYIFRVSTIFGT